MKVLIDDQRHEVRVGGRPVDLTLKEFRILQALKTADGRVVTREKILQDIWGYARNIGVQTRTVDQHISQLRRKLTKVRAGGIVHTIQRRGYKLVEA